MAETKVSNDESYEDLAATYQCIEIAILAEVLRENGITDETLRKTIVHQYQHGLGVFRDQQWFKVGEQKAFPVIAFTQEFIGDSENSKDLGPILVRSASYSFTEYSSGNVSEVFDSGEKLMDVQIGNVGDKV